MSVHGKRGGARIPGYLHGIPGRREQVRGIKVLLRGKGLHTVCESARCPNIAECFSRPTATFMILGNRCTRSCRFCGVEKGEPEPADPGEPSRLAAAAAELGLKYVVITSVTRDDLEDGGAGSFADCIAAIKKEIPHAAVEVLVPDFMGREQSIAKVLAAGPAVFGHNIETVPRLYLQARSAADYLRSLAVLRGAKGFDSAQITKSGLMVGLGETIDELYRVMDDLVAVGCDVLTIGQYLRPGLKCLPVARYYLPEEFAALAQKARSIGLKEVFAGPLVRSSFHADELAGKRLNNGN